MRIQHLVDDEENLLDVGVDDVDSVENANTVFVAVLSEIYTCLCCVLLPVVVLELDLPV